MTQTLESLQQEIAAEIAQSPVVIYAKGTKEQPRCGFTMETIVFFDRYNAPYTVIDVLENMPKREALNQMTQWPTLPKVFIGGKFYGDTDILDEMAAKGEIEPLLNSVMSQS